MSWTFDGTLLLAGEAGQVSVASGTAAVRALPGRFALPGLVDGHCHLTLGRGAGFPFSDVDGTQSRLRQLAETGVSVVRDVGGEPTVTLRLARHAQRGAPLVLAAGRFLAPANRYFPGLFTPVEADDLVGAVEAEVRDGASWLKIVADFPHVGDGTLTAPATASYAIDAVAAAVRAAHALGARVAAHTTTYVVSALVEAGVDSVEHGDALTAHDLEVLGARGGAWTPTLSASFTSRSSIGAEERTFADRMSALLPVALRAGVTVLAGSDVTGTVPSEIAWLHRLGLTVEQALEAAGPRALTYLDVQSPDSIVTYDTDPRSDPDVLARPTAVVLRGVRVR